MSDERAVQEVLARYVRAVDARNADTVAGLYVERGRETFSYNRGGVYEQFAVLAGSQAIRDAVSSLLAPHPPLGWARHATFDPIVAVQGNTASIDAQFVVFEVRGAQRPGTPDPAA